MLELGVVGLGLVQELTPRSHFRGPAQGAPRSAVDLRPQFRQYEVRSLLCWFENFHSSRGPVLGALRTVRRHHPRRIAGSLTLYLWFRLRSRSPHRPRMD